MSAFKICPRCRNQVVLNSHRCGRCAYCFPALAVTTPVLAVALKQESLWQKVRGRFNSVGSR